MALDFTIKEITNPEIYDRLGGSAPSVEENRKNRQLTSDELAAWDAIKQTGYLTEVAERDTTDD